MDAYRRASLSSRYFSRRRSRNQTCRRHSKHVMSLPWATETVMTSHHAWRMSLTTCPRWTIPWSSTSATLTGLSVAVLEDLLLEAQRRVHRGDAPQARQRDVVVARPNHGLAAERLRLGLPNEVRQAIDVSLRPQQAPRCSLRRSGCTSRREDPAATHAPGVGTSCGRTPWTSRPPHEPGPQVRSRSAASSRAASAAPSYALPWLRIQRSNALEYDTHSMHVSMRDGSSLACVVDCQHTVFPGRATACVTPCLSVQVQVIAPTTDPAPRSEGSSRH